MEACGGSVFTGLQTSAHWQAEPMAEQVLTPRLEPGTHLPTPCRDVNGSGHGQRGTHAPSNGQAITLTNPGHTPFANPHPKQVYQPSQAGPLFFLVLRNCHSTSMV